MLKTREDTGYYLLDEPESLKFWIDDAQADDEGKPVPDMTGKMLPTKIQELS